MPRGPPDRQQLFVVSLHRVHPVRQGSVLGMAAGRTPGEICHEWPFTCYDRGLSSSDMLSSFYRVSPGKGSPLKIGVVVDSPDVPKFFLEILEDIFHADYASLELVVRLKRADRFDRGSFLFRLYDRWDRSRLDAVGDPFEPVDIAEAIAGLASIEAELSAKGEVPPATVKAISARGLDVLLLMGSGRVTGELLQAARYGVWAYEFGDGEHYSGTPPYFWEVRDEYPLNGVRLCLLGSSPGSHRVLSQALFAGSPPANISWRTNRIRPGWASTFFVIQKLFELHSRGVLVSSDPLPSASIDPPRRCAKPSNSDMIGWLVPKMTGKAVRRIIRSPHTEHWRMAVRVGPRRLWGSGKGADTDGFEWIQSAPGHLYADPFLIRRAGRTWLFYEHYQYSERRAVIDCAEVLAGGQLGEPRLALRRNHHLSFPHVFEHHGDVFMIPETGGNRTVELYRAVNFPNEWKLEKVLLAGYSVVDTAIWFDGELWWFFATMKEPRGGGTMLVLFFADELTGEWRRHPANPICTDIRKIRGAGAIFRQNGRLLRPSQDCSVRYGYRLNFHEITALNPDEYREECVFTLDPTNWAGLVGVHTYNQCAGAEAIDGCVLATTAETGGYTDAVIAPKDSGDTEPAVSAAEA